MRWRMGARVSVPIGGRGRSRSDSGTCTYRPCAWRGRSVGLYGDVSSSTTVTTRVKSSTHSFIWAHTGSYGVTHSLRVFIKLHSFSSLPNFCHVGPVVGEIHHGVVTPALTDTLRVKIERDVCVLVASAKRCHKARQTCHWAASN